MKFLLQQLNVSWFWVNLEIKMVTGEKTSSGWRKTY